MRVCYLGSFQLNGPRNAILRRGLEANGATVLLCRVPDHLAPSHQGHHGYSGRSLARLRLELGELWRTAARCAVLVARFRRLGPLDAVVLAEGNQGLAPLAWLLARWARAPLIVDFLESLYESAVKHLQVLTPDRPRARYRRLADVVSIRLADRLLVDGPVNLAGYEAEFGSLRARTRLIQIGAPDWLFTPTPLPPRTPDRPVAGSGLAGERHPVALDQSVASRPFGSEQQGVTPRPLEVLYFGNYTPWHGVGHVIAAARKLRDDPRFRFVLVGAGRDEGVYRRQYSDDPSGNLEFRPRVAQEEVPSLIAGADICLGGFGVSGQSRRSFTHKIWQSLASGRPLVTADEPSVRVVLEHGRHCLLVPHGDPDAIVTALRRLADDPELARTLATEAATLVREHYSPEPLGRQLLEMVEEARGGRVPAAPHSA